MSLFQKIFIGFMLCNKISCGEQFAAGCWYLPPSAQHPLYFLLNDLLNHGKEENHFIVIERNMSLFLDTNISKLIDQEEEKVMKDIKKIIFVFDDIYKDLVVFRYRLVLRVKYYFWYYSDLCSSSTEFSEFNIDHMKSLCLELESNCKELNAKVNLGDETFKHEYDELHQNYCELFALLESNSRDLTWIFISDPVLRETILDIHISLLLSKAHLNHIGVKLNNTLIIDLSEDNMRKLRQDHQNFLQIKRSMMCLYTPEQYAAICQHVYRYRLSDFYT